MFDATTYSHRRKTLRTSLSSREGLVLFLGNASCARNFRDNSYPFRQDSTFLYYVGIDRPGFAAVLDLDEGTTVLYGDEKGLEDMIWTGGRPSTEECATRAGISKAKARARLREDLLNAIKNNRRVHFLPPYRVQQKKALEQLLGIEPSNQEAYASTPLRRAIVEQRSHKTASEVDQIEEALSTTARMHKYALGAVQKDVSEQHIAGTLTGIAEAHASGLAYQPTCSVNGEVLHNHTYDATLESDDLLLVDAGAESSLCYASDVTRVFPVDGSFTPRQRAVYQAVLDAQNAAFEVMAPERSFRYVHLRACRVLSERLIDIGLMTGRAQDAVEAGAHALFFPHGLGHMLGLDSHDMENLGEDLVGYTDDQERSTQFGMDTLRLARPLKPGFVVTVEPGCYFIPSLIDRWARDKRHTDFIDYDAVREFQEIGGIRIEDDVLVTEEEISVLGPSIPKTVSDVEAEAGTGSPIEMFSETTRQ